MYLRDGRESQSRDYVQREEPSGEQTETSPEQAGARDWDGPWSSSEGWTAPASGGRRINCNRRFLQHLSAL